MHVTFLLVVLCLGAVVGTLGRFALKLERRVAERERRGSREDDPT